MKKVLKTQSWTAGRLWRHTYNNVFIIAFQSNAYKNNGQKAKAYQRMKL